MDRTTTLEEILAQDPNNILARYGLAMEYANSGQTDRALETFRALLSSNPDYPAAYFMSAQTLVKANRVEEARKMLVMELRQPSASEIRTPRRKCKECSTSSARLQPPILAHSSTSHTQPPSMMKF